MKEAAFFFLPRALFNIYTYVFLCYMILLQFLTFFTSS